MRCQRGMGALNLNPDLAYLQEKVDQYHQNGYFPRRSDSVSTRSSGARSTTTILGKGLTEEPLVSTTLRYRTHTLWIFFFYIALLVVPWALTCVLAHRPLFEPSYVNQAGDYSPTTVAIFNTWLVSVRVMNSISSLITVPVVSAALAHAAVVFSQRKRASQRLDVQQTFALADRGWQDVIKMVRILIEGFRDGKSGENSWFLWIGSTILIVSAGVQPLQQLLVSTRAIQLVTCNDIPGIGNNTDPLCIQSADKDLILGYDPEPADLQVMPQNIVVQQVAHDIATVNQNVPQDNLWPENLPTNHTELRGATSFASFLNSGEFNGTQPFFYVASMANGTNTGVLRQHALRYQSKVQCEHIEPNAAPFPCAGPAPFMRTYTQNNITVSVCAPGNMTQSPWTTSRNLQNITEQLFLRVQMNGANAAIQLQGFDIGATGDFAMACTANTTRGYFEIGNHQNGGRPGRILHEWPSTEKLQASYNDYLGNGLNRSSPSVDGDPGTPLDSWNTVQNPDPYNYKEVNFQTPGPLTTTAIAIFGNSSFFHIAQGNLTGAPGKTVQQICQPGTLPFVRLSDNPTISGHNFAQSCSGPNMQALNKQPGIGAAAMGALIWNFAGSFNSTSWGEEALTAGMFFANRAMLVQTAAATQMTSARAITMSHGTPLQVFQLSRTKIIVISVLIGLDIILLIGLCIYIYSVPTWTATLDSYALAKMVSTKETGSFGPISEKKRTDTERLKEMDGLVGIAEDGPLIQDRMQLLLGGRGIITRKHASKTQWFERWRFW